MSKPTECTTPRVNPNVNYRFRVMMCQCRFINCNKCPTLVQDVDSGEGCTHQGRGYMATLYFPLNLP